LVCARTARSARRSQHYWHRLRRLAHALGLGLSDEKRQEPSQRITYTGIVVDSFCHTLSIPPKKKARMAACLEEFLTLLSATAHDIASLRGRLQHYSICLPHVLPFVALFSSLLGTEAEPDYNRPVDNDSTSPRWSTTWPPSCAQQCAVSSRTRFFQYKNKPLVQNPSSIMSSCAPSSISFAQLLQGRDVSVRVTSDGLIYAIDLVMVVTGLERDQAGLALRRVLAKSLLFDREKHQRQG
jgi:hypothetical protein